ncbi:MAG: molybdenum cofactor guanylyltransferase [Nocardioidaceae bacterium]
MPSPRRFSAIVLTGGTAARMDGADKAGLRIGGVTLLERALAAVADADHVVVAGDPVATSYPVEFTREHPAGGGPAAGLLAGVEVLGGTVEIVVVLAVDMPHVDSGTVDRLLAAVSHDGAVLVDAAGRRQLAAAYRVAALPRPEAASGLSMRRLVQDLDLVEVASAGDEAADVDTWAELRRLES